jgi:hypothetical protein
MLVQQARGMAAGASGRQDDPILHEMDPFGDPSADSRSLQLKYKTQCTFCTCSLVVYVLMFPRNSLRI